jgi:myo-inositol 2-dehydrogenase/D-chiro-inositol 1-dehydrogenase
MENIMNHRREFLSAAAALAGSAALSSAQDREIRTGFIGVGSRGGSLLKQTVTQQNVKVAAICDIDPETRDRALSLAGRDNPKSLTQWKAMLDLKDVDAVFIGTPCYLHAEMAAACLEAGKYVYCEKPLGITPEQIALVLRAARRSGTSTAA